MAEDRKQRGAGAGRLGSLDAGRIESFDAGIFINPEP